MNHGKSQVHIEEQVTFSHLFVFEAIHANLQRCLTILLLAIATLFSSDSYSLNLHVSPQPQVNNKTCQSYMSVFALAMVGNSGFNW